MTEKTVDLEKYKAVIVNYMAPELAKEFAIPCKVDVFKDDYIHRIVTRVTQEILGREIANARVEYPADWWHAFKNRWFPAWAKKRWPIKVEVVELIAKELYPQMAMPEKADISFEKLTGWYYTP